MYTILAVSLSLSLQNINSCTYDHPSSLTIWWLGVARNGARFWIWKQNGAMNKASIQWFHSIFTNFSCTCPTLPCYPGTYSWIILNVKLNNDQVNFLLNPKVTQVALPCLTVATINTTKHNLILCMSRAASPHFCGMRLPKLAHTCLTPV